MTLVLNQSSVSWSSIILMRALFNDEGPVMLAETMIKVKLQVVIKNISFRYIMYIVTYFHNCRDETILGFVKVKNERLLVNK